MGRLMPVAATTAFHAARLMRTRAFFWAVVLLPLPLLVGLAPDFGVTWDEHTQRRYGLEIVYPYYTQGATNFDRAAPDLMNAYGGLVPLITAVGEKLVPSLPPYEVGHLINAVIGWLGLLFTALLARRCFGSLAGVLAVVLLLLTPRYLGH